MTIIAEKNLLPSNYDGPLRDYLRVFNYLQSTLDNITSSFNDSIFDFFLDNLSQQREKEMLVPRSAPPEIQRLLRDGFAVHDPMGYTVRRELQNMEEEMVALKEKMIQLSYSTRQYRGLFAPVRRLSDDVLSLILSLAVADDNRVPNGAATTLTSVCARWRRLAFDTPEFWATIAITPSFDPSRHLPVLNDHLSRSRGAPLTYYLDSIVGESQQALIPILFDKHAHRVQELQFPLTEWGISISFKLMETIFTRYGSGGLLPALRTVHIRHALGRSLRQFYASHHVNASLTTLATVTTLTLAHVHASSGSVLRLLSYFPHLVSVDISFVFSGFTLVDSNDTELPLPTTLPITLPALTSFTLRYNSLPTGEDYNPVITLLQSHIEAPALTSLSILICASDDNVVYTSLLEDAMVQSLTQFIHTTLKTLRELVIRGFPRSQKGWDALLPSIPPTVESLEIGDHLHIGSYERWTFGFGTRSRAEQPLRLLVESAGLAPHLRSLKIYGLVENTHVNDVFKIVRDRVATIRKVYVFMEGGSEAGGREPSWLSDGCLKTKLMEEGILNVEVGCLAANRLPQLKLQDYD
ncbi:hypothetical protein AAF712_011819 [Marasmius tenuissimus]|uniref:F-box domain-containing protein n=1 Tax=Marasmius tenuissimus TaxID=585030 RepID=A0ABR2ZIF3_9AGAR|nr:hypothetical protein PM082_016529 [Marasmius tenuissimus]